MLKNKKIRGAKFAQSPNFSSQHLLIHKPLIYEMIRLAHINSNDTVMDIGAGTGAITLPLAEKAGKVLAVENDPVYAEKLAQKTKDISNIRVRQADFLQIDLPRDPFSVISNIPFSITTAILDKLLGYPGVPLKCAILIVEKGAARRFTSVPITDPRILKWRMWFEFQIVRTVSPEHFSPRPRVDSAVLIIRKKKNPAVLPQDHAKFMALAVHGLRDPRLPFSAALGDVFSPAQITKLARVLKLERNVSICTLNEQQWGEVFLSMMRHVESYRRPRLRNNVSPKNKYRR
ncbi:23S rRNA (adenine-N6)-dimethyltransferase [Paenibacillus uliginis N3/975]|uniref:rRNA adenine N-6-methyltransferase n=1 Tax=Paenibacillus uliginis N3/975 TaxID=1313296 RepID=A0A1X7HNA3_9BACL|nr:23S ribosomal RNA methyltransferase Erm [Paenibacillus uliginis]SMF89805.1 23S rRNA (adenine-N6)-dimethyltransferase [Paenibacillus uliginis N3/975]